MCDATTTAGHGPVSRVVAYQPLSGCFKGERIEWKIPKAPKRVKRTEKKFTGVFYLGNRSSDPKAKSKPGAGENNKRENIADVDGLFK